MAFMVPFTVRIDYDTLTTAEKIELAKNRGDKKLHERLAKDAEPQVRLALLTNPKVAVSLISTTLTCDENEEVQRLAKECVEKFKMRTER